MYESSARMDVGGDVYDFLVLADGRLAVVVGDVTGHGIEATADMAMAKFVFRSLTREHPDPGDLLASANEVLVGEVPAGKFVTMVCVTVDARAGRSCARMPATRSPASCGPTARSRPSPRPASRSGSRTASSTRPSRPHSSPARRSSLYTDGVIEARRGGEQYGVERLDVALAARRHLGAHELARAVVEDCRRFAEGSSPTTPPSS